MSDLLPTNETDLFELRGPRHLFAEIQSAIVEYHREPNIRLLLFLLFALNHLREWIAGARHDLLEAKRKSGQALLPNEELYFRLWDMKEFRIINSLCNRSKHFTVKQGAVTSVTSGMTCESPCEDSLGQVYYRIDGVDSREIFLPVIRQYHEWFTSNNRTHP